MAEETKKLTTMSLSQPISEATDSSPDSSSRATASPGPDIRSTTNKIHHADPIQFQAEELWINYKLKELKSIGCCLLEHANRKKKIVDFLRRAEGIGNLSEITWQDLLGTMLIKYGLNGHRLFLNPDEEAYPDHEDLMNFKILKLAMPHPNRDPEMFSEVCKAFDYDEDTYRVVYDKHLATFNIVTEIENPLGLPYSSDEEEEHTPAAAMEELQRKLKSDFDDTESNEEDEDDDEDIDSPSPAKKSPVKKSPVKKRNSYDFLAQVDNFNCDSSFDSRALAQQLVESPLVKKKKTKKTKCSSPDY
ncbi:hypothetical protein SEMRO_1439_G272770.1 [Seminavis robusta]|uniref:Uncharacterized protein n=1 Tax=Seminavis robusta TaxID=568900 RepID=A0A9N8HSF9_9STRA|nr:hypothetical protein SEMRO_1439_G272770.1 [Seminavis robusta]|eukprot:Sro1439_g272770.1 n/a (304) ;mRNA; f:6340-7251